MGYRGDDLDLRTPQTWSTSPADLGDAREGGNGVITQAEARRVPIWVDDPVLACCNHAFDVALAHRAGEVRLEHLLHALTRIDSAAEALEARGIRVTGLRRETGTIVASEIPVGFTNGRATPGHSEAMEAVLRAASAAAARRREPGTVDDILDVLLDSATDLPGLDLLHRHRVWVREANAYGNTAARLSTYSLPPEYADDKGASPRERRRQNRSPFSGGVDETPSPRFDRRDERGGGLGEQIRREFDSRLGPVLSRLQTIEQGLGRLGDAADSPSQMIDRLSGIEKFFEGRLGELARSTSDHLGRLTKLEQSLRDAITDSGRTSMDIKEQIRALDQTLPAKAAAAIDLKPVGDRLSIIEEALLGSDQGSQVRKLLERLGALEQQMAQQRAAAIEAELAFKQDIKALTSAFASQAASGERVQNYISDRIAAFASMLDRQRGEIEASVAVPLMARTAALASQAEAVSTQQSRGLAILEQRLMSLENTLAQETERSHEAGNALSGNLDGLKDALTGLDDRQQSLAGAIDQWRLDELGDLGIVGNRLTAIEQANVRPARMIELIGQTVDSIYRTLHERELRRNRFWIWLFATSDWVGDSWPRRVPSAPPLPPAKA